VLALLTLGLGLYPQALTQMTNATVTQLLSQLAQSKLGIAVTVGM
jgi:NADH-quinone oxidoreductase subunit M